MTMHIVSPALTTTRTSRRNRKLSKGQIKKYQEMLVEHNKFLKRMKMKQLSFDEFVDYMRGTYSNPQKDKNKPNYFPENNFVSSKEKYASLELDPSTIGNSVSKKQENVYTGDRLIGIAVMHKSNLVPVFSRDDAVEISKMRRG